MIRIMLMDDHQMVRDGMKVVLESAGDIVVIGEASEPDELKKLLAVRQPDVVVLDLVIGRLLVGFDVLEVLHAKYPEVKFLIVSMLGDREHSERAFKLGASGFLPKREAAIELLEAVRMISKGQFYLSPDITRQMISHFRRHEYEFSENLGMLTKREREIFLTLGTGKTSREIAEVLGISFSTVGTHLENIKQKMGAISMNELSRRAMVYVLDVD
jgi:DNA-binding NarL/FixJ family response regulator